MYVLRLKNRSVEGPDSRGAAIPIDQARVCSVCWTVHQNEECPECKARQWRDLGFLLRALGLDPWGRDAEIRFTDAGIEARVA